jgi:hypothetical protein
VTHEQFGLTPSAQARSSEGQRDEQFRCHFRLSFHGALFEFISSLPAVRGKAMKQMGPAIPVTRIAGTTNYSPINATVIHRRGFRGENLFGFGPGRGKNTTPWRENTIFKDVGEVP